MTLGKFIRIFVTFSICSMASCGVNETSPAIKATTQPIPTVLSTPEPKQLSESKPTPEPDINSTSNHPCPLVTNEKDNQNLPEESIQLKQGSKILKIEPTGICSHPTRDEIYILEKNKVWVTSTEMKEAKPFPKKLPEYAESLRYCITDTKGNIYFQNQKEPKFSIIAFQFNKQENNFSPVGENNHITLQPLLRNSFTLNPEGNLVIRYSRLAGILINNVVEEFKADYLHGSNEKRPSYDNAHEYLLQQLGEKLSDFPLIFISSVGFYDNKMYVIDGFWREIFVVAPDNRVSIIPTLAGRKYTKNKFPAVWDSNGKMRFHNKYKVFINGIGRLNWFDPEVGCNPYLTEESHRDFTIGSDGHVYVVSERGLGRIKLSAEMFERKL